jgi:hypothetical protein
MVKLTAILISLGFFSLINVATAQETVMLTQDQAVEFIKGKTHNSTRPAGGNPRLQFRENGMMFGNNQGSSDSGKWRIEDGKLCMQWNRWEYQGCGQLVKVGDEIRHLYPDGQTVHLVFAK